MSRIAAAVAAALEAQKRIPGPLRGYGFFGENDWWLFIAVMDNHTCMQCQDYADRGIFNGVDLRRLFPYLEVESENRVWANVHPNCRCFLVRMV